MQSTAEKRTYWEEHLAAWKRSGLTQRDYCTRENIAYGSFKNWRSQLLIKHTKPLSFVEATIEAEKPDNVVVLQISLTNGSRISVSAQASHAVVEQVLKLSGWQP